MRLLLIDTDLVPAIPLPVQVTTDKLPVGYRAPTVNVVRFDSHTIAGNRFGAIFQYGANNDVVLCMLDRHGRLSLVDHNTKIVIIDGREVPMYALVAYVLVQLDVPYYHPHLSEYACVTVGNALREQWSLTHNASTIGLSVSSIHDLVLHVDANPIIDSEEGLI